MSTPPQLGVLTLDKKAFTFIRGLTECRPHNTHHFFPNKGLTYLMSKLVCLGQPRIAVALEGFELGLGT